MTKRLHAEAEYSGAYLMLFEEIQRYGTLAGGSDHPVTVAGRYVMAPSPIPRFDNPKLNFSRGTILLGAGREKKIYAVPPFTPVVSLAFDDFPFRVESFEGKQCRLCGATRVFLDEIPAADGSAAYQCNDTGFCQDQQTRGAV